MNCPACGSASTVGHGNHLSGHLRVAADGVRVEQVDSVSPRLRCRACGRTSVTRPAGADDAERGVRDHVSALAFSMGRAGASRASGLGPAVVERLTQEWREARGGDVADAQPDFVLVERVPFRGGEGLMVADVDSESLVEVADGIHGLKAWLGRPGMLRPLRACVPVDPALAREVSAALPEAVLMVAPAAFSRAVSVAAASGLSSLRRDPAMRRRNAFPGAARFLRAMDGRAVAGEGWPVEVTGLLSAARAARDIATARDGTAGAALWPEAEMAAAAPGCGPLRRLLAAWRQAVLAGLDHRFVDAAWALAQRARRLASARRPSLPFRDFRGLALLLGCGRSAGADGMGSVASGVPLARLAEILRSPVPGAPQPLPAST